MPNVTYVFKTGRKEDFINNALRANDFYYGAKEFKKQKFLVNIIEYKKNYEKKSKFLLFVDKVLVKITKFPFSTSKLITAKNFKIFLKSDLIFLINESVSLSFLPFAIILKLFKKTKINIFLMGISNFDNKNKGTSYIQRLITILLFNFSDNIYFLGKGELNYANSNYHKYSKKFKFISFAIDYDFWHQVSANHSSSKSGILFVGNDEMRDFDLLYKIANRIHNIHFTIVTQKISKNYLLSPNITIIAGSLHDKKISDLELAKLYTNAKIVIIPLKDSLQPSGQSVAMQAMASNTPVVISKTKGFWDFDSFKDKHNIFFVDPNNLENWVNLVRKIYKDEKLLIKITNNANNLIYKKYNTQNFYKFLLKDNFE